MALHLSLQNLKKFKTTILTGIVAVIVTLIFTIIVLNLRNPQKELAYEVRFPEGTESTQFSRVLGSLMGPPFVGGNKIQALYNGDEIFPAMLKAIHQAQKTITFESYIYWSGETGKQFADALSERAKAGVKVHVLIDWVGSQKIDESFIEHMLDAGVEVERYHQPRWYNMSRMNNRTHRKILVVDGKVGFTGGVGIADEWGGDGLDPKHWRDTHFQVEGPVVRQMQATFLDNWMKTRPEVHSSADYFPEISEVGKSFAQMFKSSSREGGSSVRIMYLLALASAKKSIYIENAYFVPDEVTLNELVKARKRGVTVQLIVPGPRIDALVVRHASREQWGPLLEAGVEIYEYQPAMFHCKVLIVDDVFVSIGSTNFDERSFRLNDEANLNVLDQTFARKEIQTFEKDRSRSQKISVQKWKDRPFKDRILEKISILFRSQF